VKLQPDPTLIGLLDEFAHLDSGRATATSDVMMPLVMNLDGSEIRLFSTITTFGNPREVTLSELSIETFYPADSQSRAWLDTQIANLGLAEAQ
jgi:hypothetical protein